ncbi:tetratricopeptide repeat protein 9C [Callorhinchus milii]|uniref:tetratricopeptide repeat protein 9C n=1 Tax=Callorhinchus milii TaxID=7868 RepID=UPI001C3F8D0F|nr:tetratricopeptide repeat protein 9C [Callorhinchus milii]
MEEPERASGAAAIATQALRGETVEERLQRAVGYKAEGNEHYKARRLSQAIRRYHWALLHLRGVDPNASPPLPAIGTPTVQLSPQQSELLYSTQCDCYNNLAAWSSRRNAGGNLSLASLHASAGNG